MLAAVFSLLSEPTYTSNTTIFLSIRNASTAEAAAIASAMSNRLIVVVAQLSPPGPGPGGFCHRRTEAGLLRAASVPTDGSAARQLTAGQLRSSDLALALTTAHRADMLQLAPATLRRSFTLLEFARIVGSADFPAIPAGDVTDRLRAMVTVASRHRMLGGVMTIAGWSPW